uniref:Uncharacterized protein n=1 Tax=Panthera leo TaxID=9689 RepID=A0A8C8Y7Q9_PANLE
MPCSIILEFFLTSCVISKTAEEFQILTQSWQHSSAFNSKVFFFFFFVMMDYDESPEALQLPQLMSFLSVHFSAKKKFTSDDIYHLEGRGIPAEQMAAWVAERTKKGQHQSQEAHKLSRSLQAGAIFGSFGRELSLCFVIVMISSLRWTHINRAPYAQRDPRTGLIHYIHAVGYCQFLAEICIISLFNMCITLGMVLLDKAATSRTNIIKRKKMSLTGTCLVVVFFNWLLFLFKVKEPKYPFSILMGFKGY